MPCPNVLFSLPSPCAPANSDPYNRPSPFTVSCNTCNSNLHSLQWWQCSLPRRFIGLSHNRSDTRPCRDGPRAAEVL